MKLVRNLRSFSTSKALPALRFTKDRYNGCLVDSESFQPDPRSFSVPLGESISAGKGVGLRGVWLRIPAEQSQLVSVAIDEHKFTMHHAK